MTDESTSKFIQVILMHLLGAILVAGDRLAICYCLKDCRSNGMSLLQAEGDLLGLLGLSPPASGTTVKPSSKPSEDWATF